MDDETVTMTASQSPELERIKDRAKDLREDVGALTAETMVALRKSIDDLTALLTSNAWSARNRGYEQLSRLEGSIRSNPLQSIALAACGGLIIGLWRRRNLDR
jgi:ElaB/YqjD/DUF883 family membrane-anchored ribosome-binding protein